MTADAKRPAPAPATSAITPRALRPKDAATLILVDDRGGAPRVLMGRRRDDLVFMPGKYVFPGGRVDAADRRQVAADALGPAVEAMLLQRMKGRPSGARARGLALAAVREAFEETGVVVGLPADKGSDGGASSRDGRASATWAAFEATGNLPALAPLRLLARAITPPGRLRRYDTRFFLASAASIAVTVPHRDEELSHIDWFTLDQVRALDLPGITRAIVDDLGRHLERPSEGGSMPFYYFQTGAFRRLVLATDGSSSDPIVWRR